jgi:hypothetical protein
METPDDCTVDSHGIDLACGIFRWHAAFSAGVRHFPQALF